MVLCVPSLEGGRGGMHGDAQAAKELGLKGTNGRGGLGFLPAPAHEANPTNGTDAHSDRGAGPGPGSTAPDSNGAQLAHLLLAHLAVGYLRQVHSTPFQEPCSSVGAAQGCHDLCRSQAVGSAHCMRPWRGEAGCVLPACMRLRGWGLRVFPETPNPDLQNPENKPK